MSTMDAWPMPGTATLSLSQSYAFLPHDANFVQYIFITSRSPHTGNGRPRVLTKRHACRHRAYFMIFNGRLQEQYSTTARYLPEIPQVKVCKRKRHTSKAIRQKSTKVCSKNSPRQPLKRQQTAEKAAAKGGFYRQGD